jgi:hypothetical protein
MAGEAETIASEARQATADRPIVTTLTIEVDGTFFEITEVECWYEKNASTFVVRGREFDCSASALDLGDAREQFWAELLNYREALARQDEAGEITEVGRTALQRLDARLHEPKELIAANRRGGVRGVVDRARGFDQTEALLLGD